MVFLFWCNYIYWLGFIHGLRVAGRLLEGEFETFGNRSIIEKNRHRIIGRWRDGDGR